MGVGNRLKVSRYGAEKNIGRGRGELHDFLSVCIPPGLQTLPSKKNW